MSHQLPLIDNAGRAPGEVGKANERRQDPTPPASSGQSGQVLNLIRQHQPLISLRLTVIFRGVERRNVASYSLGTPEWPRPGFFDGGC